MPSNLLGIFVPVPIPTGQGVARRVARLIGEVKEGGWTRERPRSPGSPFQTVPIPVRRLLQEFMLRSNYRSVPVRGRDYELSQIGNQDAYERPGKLGGGTAAGTGASDIR